MALLTNSLSVWKIGFRWADLDPDNFWLRLPMPARDNFSLLMDAILSGEILCETLTLAKRPSNSKADPEYYIRTHIDDVYSCIFGTKFNRKLLKWATIDRHEFYYLCEARSIPHPEFWFPQGWKLSFEMPEGGTRALWAEHVESDEEGYVSISYERYPGLFNQESSSCLNDVTSLRQNQITRLFCQQVATQIWKDDINRTIPSVVNDDLIQKYAGGSHYQEDTVKGWLKEVAPPAVRSRRGRPKKNRFKEPS